MQNILYRLGSYGLEVILLVRVFRESQADALSVRGAHEAPR